MLANVFICGAIQFSALQNGGTFRVVKICLFLRVGLGWILAFGQILAVCPIMGSDSGPVVRFAKVLKLRRHLSEFLQTALSCQIVKPTFLESEHLPDSHPHF